MIIPKVNVLKKLSKVKLLALDFDGVMTDGFVYIDEDGKETVRCSRKDGMGVELLRELGIRVVVVSKEINNVVKARCKKLNIEYFDGLKDGKEKLETLIKIMEKDNLSQNEVVFLGDDVQDIECLSYVAVRVTVADGHTRCRQIAQYITRKNGGDHAVRELCDLILEAKNSKQRIL